MITLGFTLEGLQYPTAVLPAVNWLSIFDEELMFCVVK